MCVYVCVIMLLMFVCESSRLLYTVDMTTGVLRTNPADIYINDSD